MAINTQGVDPQIPVIHYNKQIHVLLFILVCVLIATAAVMYQINRIPSNIVDSDAELLQAQKAQAFEEIKVQLSTAPPISQQQRNQAFEQIKKIRGQQEI